MLNPANPTFAELAATRFQESVSAAQRAWSFAFEALDVTQTSICGPA